MITITTINNSWYFLGDLVIKPNSSSAYQEENLSKNQAKDLLESVSSKRVSLSSEDLIKVQNRYDSFNSGGNVDLSEIISKIENIYKDDGVSGAILTNVEYNDGVFNYTSGTVNGYAGYTAVESISVVQSGTLTVSSIPAGVTYLAVISGNQVPNDFPAVVLTLGDGTLATTQTSYPVSYGDIIEIEWTTNSISALIDGQWVSSITEDTLNDPHLLVFSLLNTDPLYFSIPGFAAGGVRSGVLVDEIDERIAADLDIITDISTVRALAEVNQLNILDKADQSDLDILQTTVTGQGITLAQKANQTALDSLTTVVSGKATPADITSAIAALVNGAPAALDTLSEIATALAGEQAQIADLLAALALRVRVDATQSLTLAQQLQARQNINAEAVGVAASLVASITPASIGAATAVQGAKADTALQSADLAPVAFSGAYSALTGQPTIPGLSSSTPAAPTSGGTAGTATTAARGDHAHPLPTSAQITAAVLTGLASGSATAIAAADTLLQALAKLQAQASANAAGVASNAELLAPVPRKIGSSWYVSGRWYDLGYPYGFSTTTQSVPGGAVRYFAYSPLETVTLQNIATNIAGAMTAGGTMKFGIYADSGGFPAARIYASSAIAADTTGVKSTACTQTLTAGVVYWFAIFVSATAVLSVNAVSRTYGSLQAFALSGLTHTGLSDIPTSGAGAGFTNAGYAPFLSFQVQ